MDPELAIGDLKHAGIWAGIFRQEIDQAPPQVVWRPAHLSFDDGVECGVCLRKRAGDFWADFFAELGALSHSLWEGYCKAIADELRYHRSAIRF